MYFDEMGDYIRGCWSSRNKAIRIFTYNHDYFLCFISSATNKIDLFYYHTGSQSHAELLSAFLRTKSCFDIANMSSGNIDGRKKVRSITA